ACGDEHIQKTRNIDFVGGLWVFDGAGYGTQCGLVQNVVCALYGFFAIGGLAYIALNQRKVGMAGMLGDIVAMARGKVVQHHDLVTFIQKIFDKIGADKSGSS